MSSVAHPLRIRGDFQPSQTKNWRPFAVRPAVWQCGTDVRIPRQTHTQTDRQGDSTGSKIASEIIPLTTHQVRALRAGSVQILSSGSRYAALPYGVIYHRLLAITDLIRSVSISVQQCCSSRPKISNGARAFLWKTAACARRWKEIAATMYRNSVLLLLTDSVDV